MTGGGFGVTIGGRRWEPGPWLTIALISLAVALVNATSVYLEMRRAHLEVDWYEPFIWEFSSALVVVALSPLVGIAMRRWPPKLGLVRFGLIHSGLTLPFSLAHVGAIYVLRSLVYWAAGARYGFFDDGVALVLLYEWRKDVLAYAVIGFTYWLFDHFAERGREAAAMAGGNRIEVRDAGATVFLAPSDIVCVEAAGNYVEFHTAARTHLVRGTLAGWEARLSLRGFVRAHRSRLVNRARIAAIRPTPSGDIEIAMDDGRVLAGSRRYRGALESGAAARV